MRRITGFSRVKNVLGSQEKMNKAGIISFVNYIYDKYKNKVYYLNNGGISYE